MRKRASIVRTLVDESVDVILMDEPLGPLDAQTRLLLQDELLQLWQGSGRTILFVTHDIVEAIALLGPDRDLHERPRSDQGDPRGPDPAGRATSSTSTRRRASPEIYDAIWNDLRDEIRKAREAGRA